MKIAVTSNGAALDAQASPIFGRCPSYVFVDTETMEYEAVENPAVSSASGAGVQAAQFVVERGAQAVVTGNIGPNAFNVFQSAGAPVYVHEGGTVRQVVDAYKAGQLFAAFGATGPAHAGMGMGRRPGRGLGMGMGRGMAIGGRATPSPSPSLPASTRSREEEIATLEEMASNLRKQLTEVMDRLDQLEKGE
jgi:predicted Fe-Mo cluster-binding NifX family protein